MKQVDRQELTYVFLYYQHCEQYQSRLRFLISFELDRRSWRRALNVLSISSDPVELVALYFVWTCVVDMCFVRVCEVFHLRFLSSNVSPTWRRPTMTTMTDKNRIDIVWGVICTISMSSDTSSLSLLDFSMCYKYIIYIRWNLGWSYSGKKKIRVRNKKVWNGKKIQVMHCLVVMVCVCGGGGGGIIIIIWWQKRESSQGNFFVAF